MLAQAFVAASASIILLLGAIHLAFTFLTRKLSPRNPDLECVTDVVGFIIALA